MPGPIKKKKKTAKKPPAKKKVAKKPKLKGPVYGVPWIEVEFGQRDEGWALFTNKEQCIKATIKASKDGPYSDGGGYLGPERPLRFYEIPAEGLEKEYADALAEKGTVHTANRWSPKYKGPIQYIANPAFRER